MFTQLTLGMRLRDDATFDNFVEGDNAELIATVQSALNGQMTGCLMIWGEQGAGKTHLLQAAYQYAETLAKRAFYLPLHEAVTLDSALLQDLDAMDVLLFDDIEAISDNMAWQEAVFHLYNRLRDAGKTLVITGLKPPAQLSLTLPDLRTRLGADLVFHCQPLSDQHKMLAIQQRAEQRGFELPDAVCTFMISRLPRQMDALLSALDTLDQASLAEQRKLTVPFVKDVLSL
ncbi:MAG: DnaA regulatory inactivator Hda [marine bacterium B5-7]|nr:MAG: DnaA regulatory inactivator Hda [marine bacterium B5-7]